FSNSTTNGEPLKKSVKTKPNRRCQSMARTPRRYHRQVNPTGPRQPQDAALAQRTTEVYGASSAHASEVRILLKWQDLWLLTDRCRFMCPPKTARKTAQSRWPRSGGGHPCPHAAANRQRLEKAEAPEVLFCGFCLHPSI